MGSESSKSERKPAPSTQIQTFPHATTIKSTQQNPSTVAGNVQQSQANLRATYLKEQQQKATPVPHHHLDKPPVSKSPIADVNKDFQQLEIVKKVQVEHNVVTAKKAEPLTANPSQLNIEKTSRPVAKPSTVQQSKTFTMSQHSAPSHDTFKAKLKSSSPIEIRRFLINNPYLSDVTFSVGVETIYAHKAMLITSSRLFREHFEENKSKTMEINWIERETLINILTFCYTDKITITMDNLLALLMASHALEVRQIVNNCHGQVQASMSPDNVFEILFKAKEMNYEPIQKRCVDFLIMNEQKCFNSSSFFSLSIEDMNKVLELCKFMPEKMHEMTKKYHDGPSSSTQSVPNVSRRSASQPPRVVYNSNMQEKGAIKNKGNTNNGRMRRDREFIQLLYLQAVYKNHYIIFLDSAGLQAPGNAKVPHHRGQKRRELTKSRENLCLPQLQLHNNNENNNYQICPDLMSLPINQFENVLAKPNVNNSSMPMKLNPVRPFANSPPLINYDESVANHNSGAIITHDDGAICGPVVVVIMGDNRAGNVLSTTFSRIDFVCKRAMFINEIKFSEDLSAKGAQVIIRIATYDNRGVDVEMHKRTIDPKPDKRFNFMKFDRTPLMIYGGQKFYIKMSFNRSVILRHINKQGISTNDFVDLPSDNEIKNYFNCVQSLVVSSALNA